MMVAGDSSRRDSETQAAPPLQTYAVLDAAKVANLPELLEDSGLEHRCLFKGDAYETLKNVAPWIVRLEEESHFTRCLFTQSKAPGHLWSVEPGIFLRSRHGLDEVWRHFRKFTRTQDRQGKWFYNRFWDARGSGLNIPDSGSDPASSMFRGTILDTLIAIDAKAGRAVVRSRTADHVSDEAVDVVDGRYTISFLHKSVGHLLSYAQPSISASEGELLALARAHISEFREFDLKTAPATGLALGILYVSGRSLHNLAAVDRTELISGGGSQYGRYRRHFDYLLDMRS